jgi:hypothetical protein
MPFPERLEIVQRYTLPTSLWREYMAHYLASCFESIDDYHEQRQHRWSDPLGALCANWTSRVFEVRFDERILLDGANLVAVFIPRRSGNRDSLKIRSAIQAFLKKASHVQIEYYDGGTDTLRTMIRQWLRSCRGVRKEVDYAYI